MRLAAISWGTIRSHSWRATGPSSGGHSTTGAAISPALVVSFAEGVCATAGFFRGITFGGYRLERPPFFQENCIFAGERFPSADYYVDDAGFQFHRQREPAD